MLLHHGATALIGLNSLSAQTPVSFPAMELTMAQLYKWSCYGIAGLTTMFGGLEYKIVSPAVFDFVATAVAIIGKTGFYDGAPNSFWNFGG
jgi:hypothetical protein